MATFVLIPGGWGGGWVGGWVFETVSELLRAAGHDAWPVTLAG